MPLSRPVHQWRNHPPVSRRTVGISRSFSDAPSEQQQKTDTVAEQRKTEQQKADPPFKQQQDKAAEETKNGSEEQQTNNTSRSTEEVGTEAWSEEQTPEKESAEESQQQATNEELKLDSVRKEMQEICDKKDAEILTLKDKYLRSVANFRNLQERSRRDAKAAKDFAIQKFAADLLASVDTLHLALSKVPAKSLDGATNPDLVALHDGLTMTENEMSKSLNKHGLVRFDPSATGDKFDPNFHEAVYQAPLSDKDDGTIIQTEQIGYMLNGRVLRAAKVGVVKNS